MADDRRVAAYERVGRFIWAVRKARGWTQAEVYSRTDAAGRPYVGESTYGYAEKGKWPGSREPYPATWRALNMALKLPPATLQAVFRTEDHGFDPATVPEWEVPSVFSSTDLEAAERRRLQQVAERIADRAANGKLGSTAS